jgi:hypothetical protein
VWTANVQNSLNDPSAMSVAGCTLTFPLVNKNSLPHSVEFIFVPRSLLLTLTLRKTSLHVASSIFAGSQIDSKCNVGAPLRDAHVGIAGEHRRLEGLALGAHDAAPVLTETARISRLGLH